MYSENQIEEKIVNQLKNLERRYCELLQDFNRTKRLDPVIKTKKRKGSCTQYIKSFFQKSMILLIVIVLLSQCSYLKKQDSDNLYRKELSEKFYKIRDKDSLEILLQQYLSGGDDLAAMLCYKEVGKYQRDNARFSDAISSHQEGLSIAVEMKDTSEIIQALNNLGTDFRRIGALSEASDYHYRALKYSENYSGVNTPVGIKNRVVSMNGIGNVSLTLGYDNDAEKYFRAALQDEVALNSHIGQAINLANLGSIFERRCQYDSARVYYQLSMEKNSMGKSDMGVGLCLIHLGNLYKIQNRYEEAKVEYIKAYNIMEKISDRWHWLEACISIAQISLLSNDVKKFNDYIRMAEETANHIKSPEHIAAIYKLKHDFSLKQGDYIGALRHFKQSIAMNDSVQGIKKATRYMDLRLDYEKERNAHYIKQMEIQNKEKQEDKQRAIYIAWSIVFVVLSFLALLYYAYRQRTRSNEYLEKMEKSRSDFFANITHEFRTPLTVIQGLNELLKDRDNLSSKEKDAYRMAINRQTNNLLNLVNQLLDIARLKAGKDTPIWKHGDIISYLNMTAETFRLFAEEKRINLTFYSDIDSQEMDFVPFYIDKIVSNLLSNAIKHTKAGDKINFIVLKGERTDAIVIRVIDNGEGIPKDDLERIFEMFYQSKNTNNAQGSGIGLSFTRMMVEKMEGTITVESQLGKGSAFTITLPLKNRCLTDIAPLEKQLSDTSLSQNIEKEKPPYTSEAIDNETINSSKPIVLVVEDNGDIAMYIKSLIDDRYRVVIARDGQEGLEIAEKRVPDLVITDVMMPVKDGYQLCREMKQHELLNHIPIIMLTAKSTDEDRIDGLRCGVDAYIRKPFHSDELLIRVDKILENRHLLIEKYRNALLNPDYKYGTQEDRTNHLFLQKIISIIHTEINNPKMSAAFLADRMALSISQLNRKVSAISGQSVMSYVLHVRINKAAKMLKDTSNSITEIADFCGFYDVSYFSRVFKKEFGVSPSQYKKTENTNL